MGTTKPAVQNRINNKLLVFYITLMVFTLWFPLTLQANEIRNTPTINIVLDANAKANIESAIEFLRAWGLVNEADNIQKWLNDNKIELDLDISGAETSTTSGDIKLDGILLLGGGKESKNLQHKFDPANANDKERIVELAFTLVHEKVHAHQSFASFVYNREGNETDAYNKEITDADNTLNKMDAELNKAINNGDKAKEKQLLEWIGAVLQVKINAIETFGNEYSLSRKMSWPDRVLEDLKKLKKINDEKLKQFSVSNSGTNEQNEAFKTLLSDLNAYENTLPAKPMPDYWMKVNENSNPYIETKTNQDIKTISFNIIQGKIKVYLPSDMMSGDHISGCIGIQNAGTTAESLFTNQTEMNGYVVEINKEKTNVNKKGYTHAIPTTAQTEGLVISLMDKKGKTIGSTVVSIKTTPVNTIPTANEFQLPSVGLQGEQFSIKGSFDGNAENTKCTMGNKEVDIIAESPRQIAIVTPLDVIGLTDITITEGTVVKKYEYHNLELQLSAAKTTLVKGERTTLAVKIDGLQGIKNTTYVRLECRGTVNMRGGDLQFLEINPQDIQTDGTWTKTRTLISKQNGGFQVSASVVDKKP